MPSIGRTLLTPEEREAYALRIQAALGSLHAGIHKSPGEAARAFSVHPTTLRNRWLGRRRDNSVAHESQRLLTAAQSEALVSWCIHLSLVAQPLDRTTLGQYVYALCGRYPSSSWVERFVRKHRDLLVFRSTMGIDPKRARAFNKPTVGRHFQLFRSVMLKYSIPIENLYNMDEKGVQLGGGRKRNGRKFIRGREQRTGLKLRDPNLELITVIESISADGFALPPGFILSGTPGNYYDQWYEREGVGSIALSPNGWTDDDLTYLWFVKVFVPQAMARNISGKPILLIMDGHGSHSTDRMIEFGYQHKPQVHIYLLPPHTTHRLQPLDVGVFGVAQRRWSQLSDLRAMEGNAITRDTVVSEWMDLRHTFMREDIIRSSFAKTGLYPLDPDVFSEEDFQPSYAFSIRSHLPANYPSIVSDDPVADTSESDGGSEDFESIITEQPPLGGLGEHIASVAVGARPTQSAGQHTDLHLKKPVENARLSWRDTLPPPGTHMHTKSQMRAEVARLRGLITKSIEQIDMNAAHARLMAKENEDLRKKMNAKKGNGKRKLVTDARLLTSDEHVHLRRKEAEEEAEQARKAAEKGEQREKERRGREEGRVANARALIWNTGWRNRRKEDLKDLCYALELPMDGTRDVMIKRVEAHLVLFPSLSSDVRFRALFAVSG